MVNIKKGSESMDEDLNAVKENILLREYFRKKETEADKEKNDSLTIKTKAFKTDIGKKK